MLPDFSRREASLVELMDDVGGDREMLFRTYRQFRLINKLLCRWRRIYRTLIRPCLSRGAPSSLLDIGFGGGDIPASLERWARADGCSLHVTAIETDRRALEFVGAGRFPDGIRFVEAAAEDLAAQGAAFDFVISNAVLHHLSDEDVKRLLAVSERMARRRVIMNDILRSRAAYLLFGAFVAPLLRRSYAARDGLISIRRSFRKDELAKLAPTGWEIQTLRPYRLLAVRTVG